MALIVDPARSGFVIHTFKKGLMARLGHDLEFEVRDYRFAITGDLEGDWEASLEIPVVSLVLRGARKGGRIDASLLSADDHQEIERTLSAQVLQGQRFPVIRFHINAQQSRRGAPGRLTLLGRSGPLKVHGRIEPEENGYHLVGVARILQSAFGIKPFQALLGALKIKDEVEARWDIHLIKENA